MPPNTQAAVPAPPRPAGRAGGLRLDPCLGRPLLPGPGAGAFQANRSPEVALGRRGPTSGADRAGLAARWPYPPTHAVCNLLGLRRSPPLRSRLPCAPGAPGAEGGKEGGLESVFACPFGPGGRGPASFGCRLRELRSPGWTLGPGRRPRFPGAAVMDIR